MQVRGTFTMNGEVYKVIASEDLERWYALFDEIKAKKYCECGCGEIVRSGNNYLTGHDKRSGCKGYHISKEGYKLVYDRSIPRRGRGANGYHREHILIMEDFLGRMLLPGEVVHHIDGDKLNNRLDNLMLFESSSDHFIYEQRMKAFFACDHFNWHKCRYCHTWDDPSKLIINDDWSMACHPNRRTNPNCCGKNKQEVLVGDVNAL